MRRAVPMAMVLGLGALVACSGSPTDETTTAHVRVAVLPDQADDRLRAVYEPLIEHLEEHAGVDAELILPSSYADLLDIFDRGDADLAWFGGLTFLQAERDSGAQPLAMRDVDLAFTSDFIVAADAVGDSLDDFAGARFAFGPELSTSGHVMPRFHMMRLGLEPDSLFGSVEHTGGHDETAVLVRDGVVDIGALNSLVLESLLHEGVVSTDDVRVLTHTRPYRDYVWATRPGLSEELRIRLLDGFLSFDPTIEHDREVLALHGAGGYLPATVSDFSELRDAADLVGLLGGAAA